MANKHVAYLEISKGIRGQLKRGDKIGNRTFAYVTDAGSIATQEPGSDVEIHVAHEFNGVTVEPPGAPYTRYRADLSAAVKFGSDAFMTTNKASVDREGGWIEDANGKVIHGKKPAGTIDLTPTWRAILPILILALTDGTETGRKIAREELARMADAADAYNKETKA